MIEFKTARDGTRFFSWRGKLICSGSRPLEEAVRWAEKQSEKITDCRVVVILGLANGFHAVELAKSNPGVRICVINDNESFLVPSTQILDIQSSLFEVITVSRAQDLRDATKIKKILNESYAVVEFAPAVALNREFYNQVRDLLLGRTREALSFCLDCRRDDWSGVEPGDLKESRQANGLRLISYRDLHQQMLESDGGLRSKTIGRALVELIR